MSVLGSGTTAKLPNGYAVTVGTANQLAVPPNPTRGGLWFINNSAAAIISVCPSTIVTVASGTAPLGPNPADGTAISGVSAPAPGVAGQNAAGSITLPPGGVQIIDNQNCAGAWNCISNVSSGALTVLEF